MSDRETPARAVYDHTEDEPRPAGRRRRQVADWGVGEELFDGMPGRRFERRADHRIPRGGADDGRRTIVIDEAETPEPEAAEEEFASRAEAIRAREQQDEGLASRGEAHAQRDEAWPGEPIGAGQRDEVWPADRIVRGGVEGRRTVKIGGRPPEFHSAPARRRAVHERVGPRPDRIAAWAFALGLLLILIALLT